MCALSRKFLAPGDIFFMEFFSFLFSDDLQGHAVSADDEVPDVSRIFYDHNNDDDNNNNNHASAEENGSTVTAVHFRCDLHKAVVHWFCGGPNCGHDAVLNCTPCGQVDKYRPQNDNGHFNGEWWRNSIGVCGPLFGWTTVVQDPTTMRKYLFSENRSCGPVVLWYQWPKFSAAMWS